MQSTGEAFSGGVLELSKEALSMMFSGDFPGVYLVKKGVSMIIDMSVDVHELLLRKWEIIGISSCASDAVRGARTSRRWGIRITRVGEVSALTSFDMVLVVDPETIFFPYAFRQRVFVLTVLLVAGLFGKMPLSASTRTWHAEDRYRDVLDVLLVWPQCALQVAINFEGKNYSSSESQAIGGIHRLFRSQCSNVESQRLMDLRQSDQQIWYDS